MLGSDLNIYLYAAHSFVLLICIKVFHYTNEYYLYEYMCDFIHSLFTTEKYVFWKKNILI